ncbi:MAG: LPS-assembly protein LptD [Prevotellaceae bacterium]|jgi:lipopolysaccharide assembly outer membrane protein LptD (OstA)|nr:LPS-assembly protein LptD [Prevotellaceae bacterium]
MLTFAPIQVHQLLKANKITSITVLLVLLLFTGEAFAQQQQGDTLQVGDTLRHDMLQRDSLHRKRVEPKKEPLEAPVVYEAADSIVFTQSGYATLFGSGKVDYSKGPIELTAEIITMNLDSSTVFARGVEDSLGVVKGSPVFKDGDTPYETKSLRYNFNSKRGLISNVITQQGEGYVVAHNAKKGKDDELYTRDGTYSTCDNHEHPHFYLKMTYAKVRPKKNVVTGPLYLVVEDVPLPIAVPFFFFPFNDSYSSGFIMPTYMDDSNRGFGLTSGGYYFAISDKMDMQLRGDIFTKGSWALNLESNYNVRYKYSGLLQASYQVTKTGDKGLSDYMVAKDFKIVWSHRQDPKANPNTTFSASVNFASSSYERTNIGNLYNANAAAQNTKTSSVSYSRNFPDLKLNIALSSNIAQRTSDSTVSVTLPDLNISLSNIYPFKRKKAVGEERWYEKIQFRYTGRFTNSITTKDTELFKKNLIKDWKNGAQHNIPVSATFTLFKYFNLTPSINYTERWYTRKVTQDWDQESQTVQRTDTAYGFYRVYDYSGSLGINTKIYAMYKPLFAKKREIQIRHVITPTISLSARPDFGAKHYGYYDTYVRTDRNGMPTDTVSYSPFVDGSFGVPSTGKSGSIQFDISNNLEMKYRDLKKDTLIKRSLIDELGASISYNLAAQRQQWSNLNLRLRLKFSDRYTFSMNSVFATYAYAFDKNGNVITGDRTEWSYGRFGRFQGYSNSFSYTLNNDTWKKLSKLFSGKGEDETAGGKNGDSSADNQEGNEDADSRNNGVGTPPAQEKEQAQADPDGYQVFKMPWSFNLSYGFTLAEDRSKPINRHSMRYPYKLTHTLSGSGNLKIANRWTMNFNASYDFTAHQIAQTVFNISRDLHCFTMTASLSPFGRYRYYNFTIRANASILQDLKWDQRSQTQSNVRFY